jgi:hypothetical protein
MKFHNQTTRERFEADAKDELLLQHLAEQRRWHCEMGNVIRSEMSKLIRYAKNPRRPPNPNWKNELKKLDWLRQSLEDSALKNLLLLNYIGCSGWRPWMYALPKRLQKYVEN